MGLVALVLLWRFDWADRNRIDTESVVMLGDSITAEGSWSDLFPETPIVNEGHSGYTTEQLVPIARGVAAHRPRLVLLLTGTNDIRDGRPPSWTVTHLDELLDSIAELSPDTRVVIQTVLPRADRVSEVLAVNEAIRSLAAARGIPVLDLYPEFDDGRGGLRTHETYDGLHLSDPGYTRWAELLRLLIEPPV